MRWPKCGEASANIVHPARPTTPSHWQATSSSCSSADRRASGNLRTARAAHGAWTSGDEPAASSDGYERRAHCRGLGNRLAVLAHGLDMQADAFVHQLLHLGECRTGRDAMIEGTGSVDRNTPVRAQSSKLGLFAHGVHEFNDDAACLRPFPRGLVSARALTAHRRTPPQARSGRSRT